MAKKQKLMYGNPMPQDNKRHNIKKSEETYQIQNKMVVGLKKPNKPNSSSYLYNEAGMAFDRFEYGYD